MLLHLCSFQKCNFFSFHRTLDNVIKYKKIMISGAGKKKKLNSNRFWFEFKFPWLQHLYLNYSRYNFNIRSFQVAGFKMGQFEEGRRRNSNSE